MVVLVSNLGVDLGKLVLLEKSKQVPGCIKTLEDITSSVLALTQELILEFLKEDKEVLVISGKGIFTDDGLHSHRIFAHSVEGVELGENVVVILTSQLLAIRFDTDG